MKKLVAFLAVFLAVMPVILGQEEQVTHVVRAGENLYRISLRYGVDLDELIRVNGITDVRRVLVGQTLVIPGLTSPDSGDEVVNPLVAGTPVTHVVQPGESLTIIANQYDTTVEQIIQANNLANPNRILRGQELKIWTTESVDSTVDVVAEDAETAAEANAMVAYEIQPGEDLSQIARRFGMAWMTLAEINGITNPNRIIAGQTLMIPAANADGVLGIVMPVQNAGNAPTPTITVGKQIIVDLSDSRIYAYEDGQLLRSVVVSTGLPATPTVQGDFTIWHRTPAQTMSGPGYYLPNVQWVQYFYQGYGIHGTYWHNNFGQPMSRGCVNLPNHEAEWFYNFGEMGTAVRVQA